MCMRQERKLYFSGIFLVMHPIAPAARLLGNRYALEPIEHCRRLVPRMTLTFLRWRLDLTTDTTLSRLPLWPPLPVQRPNNCLRL